MVAEPDEVLLLDTSAAVALVVEDHEAHSTTLRPSAVVAWASQATPGSRPIQS